ncbi:MAG: hypothetical protein WC746_05400 [archaeon]|jgi:hypothetical protein
MDQKLKRNLLMGLVILLIAGVSFSIGFTMNSTPPTGSIPVYSGTGDVWNPSSTGSLAGTPLAGITIKPDQNAICFPTEVSECDKNIIWDGNNLIISSN